MTDLHAGDTVSCTPTRILPASREVEVRIWEAGATALVSQSQLFGADDQAACVFYAGAVARHEPHDIVRVGRHFTAKLTNVNPLRVSRCERLCDLWGELERKSLDGGYVAALLLGQNKATYSLSIEGNVFFRCAKAPLDDYLLPMLPTPTLWHKYAPSEGDTLLGQIISASAKDRQVSIDLVAPLLELDKGKPLTFPYELLGSGSLPKERPVKVGLTKAPADTMPPPLSLSLAHSPYTDDKRRQNLVVIVEDDPRFGKHLSQLLNEIGYEALYEPSPEKAERLARETSKAVVFLIDADMQPTDGITLVGRLNAIQIKLIRCILMSALSWDDPLEAAGWVPLGEAVARAGIRCAFWSKRHSSIDTAIQQLDDILLNHEDYTARTTSVHSNSFGPQAPDASLLPSEPAEYLEALSAILDDAKRSTGATSAAIFAMERGEWRVRVIVADDFLKQRSQELGAQNYLPNSNIRDLSYQEYPLLLDSDVGRSIPRFRNLLRFFSHGSMDDPIDKPGFQSVAAMRLDVGTSTRFSLFLFHTQAQRFTHDRTIPLLEQAVRRAELIILRRLHTQRSRRDQAFYLEGVARTGLRHDARSLITDIKLAADLASQRIQAGNVNAALATLQDVRQAANDAYQRITESLDRFLSEPRQEIIDVRYAIDRAAAIAAGVAAHWARATPNVTQRRHPEIAVRYPDDSRVRIHGDPNSLQRVLENLVVNAVEHGLAFVRSHVHILIEVKESDNERFPLTIFVHDNGPGIHGVDRGHVFEPLFSTKADGYGMGLAVARQIAKDTGMSLSITY